ncbi:hypothetical protein BGZ60DRAFT_212506 [Tricladium varicosporioides]|nr:hypothetical protein BGZ60DRAFT_212506 [Hymenoscyphus varicosporioides]
MFFSIKSTPLIIALNLLLHPITALVLPGSLSHTRRASLHTCLVVVNRYSDNSFITDYIDGPVIKFGSQIWEQESMITNSAWEGAPLVPIKIGSYILEITNVRNPVGASASDPGLLSFAWGPENNKQRWDSTGSQCVVTPSGNWQLGPTVVQCSYQCDYAK